MSNFCCGASKVGKISSIVNDDLLVHQVPVLYCPVCKDVEVHPDIKARVDMLTKHAKANGFSELFCQGKLDIHQYDELFENCSTVDRGDQHGVVQSQIDIALGLLTFARNIKDEVWEQEIKERLTSLSKKDVTNSK